MRAPLADLDQPTFTVAIRWRGPDTSVDRLYITVDEKGGSRSSAAVRAPRL
jgi:hypothetical protein